MGSMVAPFTHETGRDEGEPDARIAKPLLPPSENLTGTAAPACICVRTGVDDLPTLSTGWKKPLKAYRRCAAKFQRLACDVSTTSCASPATFVRAATHGSGTAVPFVAVQS